MSIGPIELVLIKFPQNRFTGEVSRELKKLVESGTIRVIDIMFVRKDASGELSVLEINDLDQPDYALFDPIVSEISGLLSEDDIRYLSAALENDSSAGLMVFENTWATSFVDAVEKLGGQVVLNERIPRAVVLQAMSEEEVGAEA
jgi:uncharacterized membrane protein